MLITCFNQQEYIEACVLSALEQDYPNLQVVVVDDHSSDRSLEILERLKTTYPTRLEVYFSETNQGVTKNHNFGLSFCRGKYIMILNGDDLFLPGKISTMTRLMEENPDCAIAFHDVEVFDASSGQVLFNWKDKYNMTDASLERLVRYGNYICSPAACIRRDSLGDLKYEEKLSSYSDWLLYVGILARKANNTLIYFPESLAKYRRHDENVTLDWKMKLLEQKLALGYIRSRYPHFSGEALLREGDLKLMESVHHFTKGRFMSSLATFLHSFTLLRLNPFAILRLPVRELLYIRKHTMDPVLTSLLNRKSQ